MMMDFDINKLRITRPDPARRQGIQRVRTREGFVKGPIPLGWITAAAQRPGRALQVAIAIWYLAGFSNARTVKLRPSTIRLFGIDRHAAYRGLHALERARLVSVRRHRGRCPTVTILLGTEPTTNGDVDDAHLA